jgi:hypothetical protein
VRFSGRGGLNSPDIVGECEVFRRASVGAGEPPPIWLLGAGILIVA